MVVIFFIDSRRYEVSTLMIFRCVSCLKIFVGWLLWISECLGFVFILEDYLGFVVFGFGVVGEFLELFIWVLISCRSSRLIVKFWVESSPILEALLPCVWL